MCMNKDCEQGKDSKDKQPSPSLRVRLVLDVPRALTAGKIRAKHAYLEITEALLVALDEDQRREFARAVAEAGNDPPVFGGSTGDPSLVEGNEADVIEVLEARIARAETEKAKREAQEKEVIGETLRLLAETPEALRVGSVTRDLLPGQARTQQWEKIPWTHPRLEEAKLAADTYAKTTYAREEQEQREANARWNVENETKKAAKLAAREAIVSRKGSASQRERFAAGVLPEDEIRALIRAEIFAPLEGERGDTFSAFTSQPRYVKLKPSDVLHGDDCYGEAEDVVFEAEDVVGLRAAEYEHYKVLEKIAAQTVEAGRASSVVLQQRKHEATCRTCSGEATRYGVLITYTVHGEQFSREYALPEVIGVFGDDFEAKAEAEAEASE